MDTNYIKRIFVRILIHTFLVASVLFLIANVFIHKYTASLVSKVVAPPDYACYYADINHDGKSEKIQYYSEHQNMTSVGVQQNSHIMGQWNFLGHIARATKPWFVDYDNDGIKEVIVFTVSNDSILMHTVHYLKDSAQIINKRICKIYKDKGVYDFTIYPCGAFDSNADGTKELFFSISTGFSKVPRNMFAYCPKRDTVLVSPEGGTLVVHPTMVDLDGDSILEFFGSISHACGNFKPDKPYSDQFNWLMVFTPDMNFKFEPVPFAAHPAITRTIPMAYGSKKKLLVLHYYQGTDEHPSFIRLYDHNGKLLTNKNVKSEENLYYSLLVARDRAYHNVCLIEQGGRVLQLDSTLNLLPIAKIDKKSDTYLPFKTDVDTDGIDEFIFPGKTKGEMIIYRNDFSSPAHLYLDDYVSEGQLSIIEEKGKPSQIIISGNAYLYTFSYGPSVLYLYRYALILPIFLLVFGFFFLIKKIKDYRYIKKDNMYRKIAELQIKSAQNQLDPHFTLNLFSSFENLIIEKDTGRAEHVFARYSKLLKSSVLNSDNIHISLKDELNFVESYIELEKFRYANKFSYKLNVDHEINLNTVVPKMILHIFVENAIKHGLKHLHSGGVLVIEGTQNKGIIHLSISDNGIGRSLAKEMSNFSTGKGLYIMDQIIRFYHQLYKRQIKYSISDLYKNNKSSGTKVDLWIPTSGKRAI